MAVSDHVDLPTFMEGVKKRNAGQPEFCQAVQEVAEDIFDFIEDKEQYHAQQILRRIAEPDRVVSFRVTWEDDNGNIRVQRGWRQASLRPARLGPSVAASSAAGAKRCQNAAPHNV